tara:strand:+ start:6452 stop:7273 length:822 start_codon:yes stop_codon:yes gene_type:complete
VLHRKVNIFFLLALVFVFILYGESQDHTQILLGILFAVLLATVAFLFNWLTIDGATAAAICGSIAYGIGGVMGAAVVLMFFISSSLISKNIYQEGVVSDHSFRRDGSQVWANGFWLSLWLLVWFLSDMDVFLLAGIASIAASASDTWATEIGGNRLKSKTRLLTTWKVVPPGSDGGISLPGTLASLAGSTLIAMTYLVLSTDSSFGVAAVIALAGFSGSFIDSYLGARFQHKEVSNFVSLAGRRFQINNNFVNWFSTGAASFISMILTLIISL